MADILVIGSVAGKAHRLNHNPPSDIDLVVRHTAVPSVVKQFSERLRINKVEVEGNHVILLGHTLPIEIEVALPGSTGERLLNIADATTELLPDLWTGVASLDVLYTLKMSHRYKKNSAHFEKTRDDILKMRTRGAKVFDGQWLKDRTAEQQTATPKLVGVTKEGFFSGDGVTYHYDHDDIHRVVALDEVPAYTMYMKDGAQVECDRAKFFAVPEDVRLRGVAEEATVLALERSQIHAIEAKLAVPDPQWSFKHALQKVCTSITSGWFREYAWENYDTVLDKYYPKEYVYHFYRAVAQGKVKKLTA